MDTEKIEQILKQSLNLDEVYVQGENSHFGVIVVSDEIAALSKIETTTNCVCSFDGLFRKWRNSCSHY